VCVDTTQLDAKFVGRAFDASLLRDLPPSTDPCGECGEFHTFVSDGPCFSGAVECQTGERVLREERFMYCDMDSNGATPHQVST
jgi:diphthamide synthase (EF-2-diphthine--ammonia ligase)